jgi:hypothetical protein
MNSNEKNVELLYQDMDTKFNKNYYRNKYVETTNKIAHMTGTIVDLQQQLITAKDRIDILKSTNSTYKKTIMLKDGNEALHNLFSKTEIELIEYKNYLKTAHWKINNLEQQLLEKQDELLKAHFIIQHLTEDVDVIDLMKRVQEVRKQREQDRLEDQAM